MNSPLVSVLIPCFNIETYGEAAISSILSQSYAHIEVILLDDGSSDNTAQLISLFASKDPRVRLVSHQQNKGIIAARNRLLHEARGEFLAWMDADDIALPERLEKQVALLMANSGFAAVSCEYIEFGDGQEVYRRRGPRDLSRDTLLFFNYVLNPGAVVRRSVVENKSIKFDETLSGASDFGFWVEVAKHGDIGVIHEPLMRYRRHQLQESTAQILRQLTGCQEIVEKQLTQIGVTGFDTADMAYFLIYPADILGMKYNLTTFRRSAAIVAQLYNLLPNADYQELALRHALQLLRRHLVRVGVRALPCFIQTVGWRQFLHGKWFGLSLLYDALRKKF